VSERILRWFGDRRNERVLEMTYEHLELTTKAVYQLYEMVQNIVEEPERKKPHYESISRYEMQADRIRRGMVNELSKRDLYPNERDDLIELVRAVDWIADLSREASRLLVIIPFEKLPESFRESVENMCRANYATVKVLSQCIHELSRNPQKALDLANQVELFEEDVDDLFGEARNQLVMMDEGELTRSALILVNELIESIEEASDWCENSADIARAIAIRVI
jgi:uncharacterized protein